MSELTVHHVTEIPYYQGEHEIPGIRFHHARQALGVSAWGMNVIALEPSTTGYPEHDHATDGQEEVYVVLSGAVELHTEAGITSLRQVHMVRVPPTVSRKLVTADEPATILALGATPGVAYSPSPGM